MAKVKFIPPREDPLERIKRRLRAEIEPVLEKGVAIRNDFTKHWSAYNTPEFYIEIGFEGTKLVADIKMVANPAPGSTENKSVYELLNEGTDVRRARLSHDFSRITDPNSLVTRPGAGGVIDVRKSYEFPGIKARNTETLANAAIQQDLKDAIKRATS